MGANTKFVGLSRQGMHRVASSAMEDTGKRGRVVWVGGVVVVVRTVWWELVVGGGVGGGEGEGGALRACLKTSSVQGSGSGALVAQRQGSARGPGQQPAADKHEIMKG